MYSRLDIYITSEFYMYKAHNISHTTPALTNDES